MYTDSCNVNFSLGGENGNELMIEYDDILSKFTTGFIRRFSESKPFGKLCETFPAFSKEGDMRKLRAYVFYAFLAAGHTQTLHSYLGFEDDIGVAFAHLIRRRNCALILPHETNTSF